MFLQNRSMKQCALFVLCPSFLLTFNVCLPTCTETVHIPHLYTTVIIVSVSVFLHHWDSWEFQNKWGVHFKVHPTQRMQYLHSLVAHVLLLSVVFRLKKYQINSAQIYKKPLRGRTGNISLKLFLDINSKTCPVNWVQASSEFAFQLWRSSEIAVERFSLQHMDTGVNPYCQKLWNLLVLARWHLRLLRVWHLFFILRNLYSCSFLDNLLLYSQLG